MGNDNAIQPKPIIEPIKVEPKIQQNHKKQEQIQPPTLLPQQKEQLNNMKEEATKAFLKVLSSKIKRNEIRTIFSDEQPTPQQTSSKDIKIYTRILQSRLDADQSKYKSLQKASDLHSTDREMLKKQFKQTSKSLISEIMGKTSIWRSLNISKANQKEKLISFLREQGANEKEVNDCIQSD